MKNEWICQKQWRRFSLSHVWWAGVGSVSSRLLSSVSWESSGPVHDINRSIARLTRAICRSNVPPAFTDQHTHFHAHKQWEDVTGPALPWVLLPYWHFVCVCVCVCVCVLVYIKSSDVRPLVWRISHFSLMAMNRFFSLPFKWHNWP